MKLADFIFDLPGELIAQYPPAERGRSRLMVLDREKRSREHRMVTELPALLKPASSGKAPLLVFNNSRVRKARLPAVSKAAGAVVEFLLINKVNNDGRTWRAMVRRAKRRRPGSRYVFTDGTEGEILGGDGEFRLVRFEKPIDDDWLDSYGHIPLPPYIKRADTPQDSDRYQTVYASGGNSADASFGPLRSLAAPTAGLHFTRELLAQLEDAGVETAFITLHVGLGTFLPVRTENIEDHRMHTEVFSINEGAAAKIEKAKAEGRPVIAVGTTSVRTLESAWKEDAASGTAGLGKGSPGGGFPGGRLQRGEGATSIFIYPGYRFKVADALFTNFHTPGSTLLMLVSGFAGREFILESYAEAVREGYRFFSYGDAMLIR